jgi:hypothetical protein
MKATILAGLVYAVSIVAWDRSGLPGDRIPALYVIGGAIWLIVAGLALHFAGWLPGAARNIVSACIILVPPVWLFLTTRR